MTDRDRIYAEILKWGLLRIREAASLKKIEYCEVEADHLHNLPSLIGEMNEFRHEFYFEEERELYLERVDRSIPGIDFTLQRYEELWQELDRLRQSG